MKRTVTAERPLREKWQWLPSEMMYVVFGVVSKKLGSGVKQTWFLPWFYYFSCQVIYTYGALVSPLYKMGIIIMATSQRFEDENNTT